MATASVLPLLCRLRYISSMQDTRFIFVEGIMGSGKTTTAWFLAEHLQGQGIAAQFMSEGCPLRVALDLPHPNGAWLDVSIEQYIDSSLQKWRTFAREVQKSGVVTACDGLLFHGNMTDLLLMNAEQAVLHRYIEQVIECIHDLHPVVIYFYRADIAHALRTICYERGSDWEEYQVSWKCGSPYGIQRSLQGFDGLVRLYQDYRSLCDEAFARLALPKLAIRNEGDWAAYYEDILRFLGLPNSTTYGVPG